MSLSYCSNILMEGPSKLVLMQMIFLLGYSMANNISIMESSNRFFYMDIRIATFWNQHDKRSFVMNNFKWKSDLGYGSFSMYLILMILYQATACYLINVLLTYLRDKHPNQTILDISLSYFFKSVAAFSITSPTVVCLLSVTDDAGELLSLTFMAAHFIIFTRMDLAFILIFIIQLGISSQPSLLTKFTDTQFKRALLAFIWITILLYTLVMIAFNFLPPEYYSLRGQDGSQSSKIQMAVKLSMFVVTGATVLASRIVIYQKNKQVGITGRSQQLISNEVLITMFLQGCTFFIETQLRIIPKSINWMIGLSLVGIFFPALIIISNKRVRKYYITYRWFQKC